MTARISLSGAFRSSMVRPSAILPLPLLELSLVGWRNICADDSNERQEAEINTAISWEMKILGLMRICFAPDWFRDSVHRKNARRGL
jgi:hypothetical protein